VIVAVALAGVVLDSMDSSTSKSGPALLSWS
jgi:hypothetical protein